MRFVIICLSLVVCTVQPVAGQEASAAKNSQSVLLQMRHSDELFPNRSSMYFGAGGTLFPVREAVQGIPDSLRDVIVMQSYVDSEQFLFQTMRKGIVSRERYEKYFSKMDTSALTPEWVDCIVSGIQGITPGGELFVSIDTDNDEDFSDEQRLVFRPEENRTLSGTIRKRFTASVPVRFEYFDGDSLKTITMPFRFIYEIKSRGWWIFARPSYRFRFTIDAYHLGEVELNDEKYRIAVSNSSGTVRPDQYTFLYIDVNGDGLFDFDEAWTEAYAMDKPFNIGGKTWQVEVVDPIGAELRIRESGAYVPPLVALKAGSQAPDFKAKTLDGQSIRLEDFRGRFVLLDFWGSWCGFCIDEIPNLKAVYEEFAGRNLTIIGICSDTEANARRAIRKYKIRWPQIMQDREEGEINKLYRVVGWPSQWLIDPDGMIVATGKALRAKQLRKTILEQMAKYDSLRAGK